MTQKVFLFGPFCLPSMQRTILQDRPAAQRARLAGHRLVEAAVALPALACCAGEHVDGWLADVSDDAVTTLSHFIALWGGAPVTLRVETPDGPVQALTHVLAPEEAAHAPDWSARGLNAQGEAVLSGATAEILALAATHPPQTLRARWSMALSGAASAQRASAAPDAARLRAPWTRGDVQTADQTRPYAWFFALAEATLRFRRFDGSFSPQIKRAGFVMSDAVTVLPYDPKRDLVMVIEQFRFGPWLRGASNCWSLEPIAGRVDGFETPETCALREAREETRLVLQHDQLVRVGAGYPSPGAVSEYLYHFAALCDLTEGQSNIAGLDSEDEDIRSHVIPFARLMDLIDSGEVENGPLMLTAFWLASQRARLQRAAAG